MNVSDEDLRALWHAADKCVSDVPGYEPHPDCYAELRKLATPRMLRALCDELLDMRRAFR